MIEMGGEMIEMNPPPPLALCLRGEVHELYRRALPELPRQTETLA
jgi:hypothetical protein